MQWMRLLLPFSTGRTDPFHCENLCVHTVDAELGSGHGGEMPTG